MNPSDSAAVVLLGGGHAHALALPLMAGKLPPGRKLILVSDAAQAPYSGMVPGHIAGHYARRECFINLPRLAEKCGAEFVPDRAVGLDLEKRAVVLEKSGALPFGILSINTGGVPRPQPECFLPEVDCAVKPVSLFAEWLDEWQGQEQTESQGQTENKVPAVSEGKVASAGDKVAVIGAGAGGSGGCLGAELSRAETQAPNQHNAFGPGRQGYSGASGRRARANPSGSGAKQNHNIVKRRGGQEGAGRFALGGRAGTAS